MFVAEAGRELALGPGPRIIAGELQGPGEGIADLMVIGLDLGEELEASARLVEPARAASRPGPVP